MRCNWAAKREVISCMVLRATMSPQPAKPEIQSCVFGKPNPQLLATGLELGLGKVLARDFRPMPGK